MPDSPALDPALKTVALCRKNGLPLDETQARLLTGYVRLLREWNEKVNLISRRDVEHVWISHLLHSLALLFFLDPPRGLPVLDLGSGGGLPGIPLAIARPDLRITLLDSIRKKTAALTAIVRALGLNNVSVSTARAEELAAGQKPAEGFSIVVARAVAPLPNLIKWSRPLMRASGESGRQMGLRRSGPGEDDAIHLPCLLALKGGDLDKEIRQARVKLRQEDIRIVDLVFAGSEELGLTDKKIVIVERQTSNSVIPS